MDVAEVLRKRGHNLIIYSIPDQEQDLSFQLVNHKKFPLYEFLEKKDWDIVFSLDYYPSISLICNKMNKLYVSWNTEPPFSNLYSSTVINQTNLIFVADKWVADNFKREGIENIFYLPEGVNLQRCNENRQTEEQNKEIECSMICNSKVLSWQELFQTEHLLDATLGYLDGLVACQNLIYGYDFFEKSLPEYLYKDLMKNSKIYLPRDSVQSIQQFYAEQCFYPRISSVDRTIAAKVVSNVANIKISVYTDDEKLAGEYLKNCGSLLYENELAIIDRTKININVCPRGFKDGIYGHALRIMGMGGFLITDYKNGLLEEFVPGKDFIIYEDMKDLVENAKHYLRYPEERCKIGVNAYEKIAVRHTLDQRIEVIEEIISNVQR